MLLKEQNLHQFLFSTSLKLQFCLVMGRSNYHLLENSCIMLYNSVYSNAVFLKSSMCPEYPSHQTGKIHKYSMLSEYNIWHTHSQPFTPHFTYIIILVMALQFRHDALCQSISRQYSQTIDGYNCVKDLLIIISLIQGTITDITTVSMFCIINANSCQCYMLQQSELRLTIL